jgi:hypothetical protein
VLGILEDTPRRCCLDDPPGVHHRDLIGHLRDHAEVVRDDHDRHAQLALQALEQREDLRLHGHVERRRRLVCDQQLRLVDQRHRDHRALAHAAGELVRVLIDAPARVGDADQSEQLDRAIARGLLGDVLVGEHRLDQLPPDAIERVKRRERILEDHRDLVAANRAEALLSQRDEILPVEEDPPAYVRALAPGQAERRQRGDRLSRARLADDAERLAAVYLVGDAVDGVHEAILAGKLDVQVFDPQQRLAEAHRQRSRHGPARRLTRSARAGRGRRSRRRRRCSR